MASEKKCNYWTFQYEYNEYAIRRQIDLTVFMMIMKEWWNAKGANVSVCNLCAVSWKVQMS